MVLKEETDFLMNTVTAVRNTNVHTLCFLPTVQVLTFFFNTFSHLALSKCCKLSLLIQICFLHFLPSFFFTCFFHLSSSSLLLWSIAPYFLMLFSPVFLTVSSPLSPCLPPSLPLSLPIFGWLVDSFYCLLSAGILSEEHSCCGQAMCGRTCWRGEPNTVESPRHLFKPVVC